MTSTHVEPIIHDSLNTYCVNAYLSNDFAGSRTNDTQTYAKLTFGEVDDPYKVFQNSVYTAPVDGLYKFEVHIHNKTNTYDGMVRLLKNGTIAINPPVIIYTQDSNGSKGYTVSLSKNETISVEYQGNIWNDSSFTAYLISPKKP